MKKVVFIFILALSFARNCHAQTWTFLQDSVATGCSAGNTSCNLNQGNNVVPTTAGSVMIVRIHTKNNVTITSVSGGGGTWQLCPASSCHVFDAAFNDNQDLAYNLSGGGGATNITVTISGAASGFFGGNFIEMLPPSGATASFDAAGTVASSTCNPCTGVGLTLSSTDLIVQVMSGNGVKGAGAWNAYSAPYITDYASDGIALNTTNGAAPTVSSIPGFGADFSAIAFKTSLGTYTPSSKSMSLVNYTAVQTGISCNPSCSFSIPATGSGNLLYLQAGASNAISSVSGGGSWIVPSSCRLAVPGSGTGGTISCAYALSSTASTTSISVTMTGSASTAFALYEVSSTAGPFTFDTAGSSPRGGSPAPTVQGIPLTLNGTNDVIFQSAWISGGSNAISLYPQPENPNGQAFLFFSTATSANAGSAVLLNTTNGTAPTWINGGTNPSGTGVTGVAFRTGTGTAPAPPTGLAAVVN